VDSCDSGNGATHLAGSGMPRLALCIGALLVAAITGQLLVPSPAQASHTPSPPVFTETDPPSPANNNNPVIFGFVGIDELGTIVELFDNPSCTGLSRGSGPANDFESGMSGIQVSVPDDSTTTFYGRASHPPGTPSSCSTSSITYVEVSTPPPPPMFTGTEPPSGTDWNTVMIKGTATPSSEILLYTDPGCTGYAGAGSTGPSGSFSVFASVPDNSTTTFYAKAMLAGFESTCSSSSITYVEVTPPPPGPEPPPPCPPPEVPAGAIYSGTHSQGGTICFTVTANWSHVTSWLVVNDLCNHWNQIIFSVPVAPDRSFRTKSFSGSFDAGKGATGTYSDRDPFGGCDTGVVTWNASTTATPPWAVPRAVVAADKAAPALQLRAKSSQRAIRQKGIVVEVRCPTEACTATAEGTVSVSGAAKTYRLKAVTKQIRKGGTAKLKLKLSKGPLTALKRALRRHRRAEARITVTVKDAAANATVKKRRIRLKR
jgi:hypothetical protein